MYNYKVKIPMILEQKANFNTHDFSSSEILEFSYEDEEFSITGKDDKYEIVIKLIEAENRIDCSARAKSIMNKITKIISLIIQTQHKNQHYTHLRLNFDINTIEFISEGINTSKTTRNGNNFQFEDHIRIHDSLSIKLKHLIQLDKVKEYINCYDDKSFIFILDSYYRAINATDEVTKYFNAFSAIEFIEASFIKYVQVSKMVSETVIDSMLECAKKELDTDIYLRVKNRLRSNLLNATLESRAEKLLKIINEVFKVNDIISGMVNTSIDLDFIKEIISIRNFLFHGKKMDEKFHESIKNKVLEIILLLQYILTNWINIDLGLEE